MSRPMAVVLLLILPAVTRADGGFGLPGIRTVWVDFVFTVEQDYPDYEFYLIPDYSPLAERLPLTPSTPVRVSGPGENYKYKWARVYAVRKSLLVQLPEPPTDPKWFWQNEGTGVVRLELPEYWLAFRKNLPFTDTRDRVEITYRVEVGPDGGRLVKVRENAGNLWVRRGWIAAGLLFSVGVVGLGIWRVRQIRHPKL